MLHKETVKGETLELLKELMRDERLRHFNLAGETSLALYMGHRISEDLDLFTPDSFDANELEAHLTKEYGFQSCYLRRNTLKGTISDIKINCATHAYPVKEIAEIEHIRLYSKEDIAAMKLSAIADNGTRLKDFIDIAYLSTEITLADMLQAYEWKYPNSNGIRPLKGLSYFNDIDFNESIRIINGSYSWDRIEERLSDMLRNQTKLYPSFPIEADKNIK